MDLGVADDAARPTSSFPASNWGLTSTTASQPGAQLPARAAAPDADEGDVGDEQVRPERKLGQLAGVRALEHRHARVVRSFGCSWP